MEGRKRVPAGEPIKDYYPRIVSDADFYAARKVVEARHNNGGHSLNTANNLFTRLCYCGECGGPVHYVDKSRGAVYLRCDRAARHLTDCEPSHWRYQNLEGPFIRWIVNFDFTGTTRSARAQREAELTAAKVELETATRKLERLTEAMALGTVPIQTFMPQIEKARGDVDRLTANIEKLTGEIAVVPAEIVRGDTAALAKVPEHRFRLREEIRRRVEKVTIHFKPPQGYATADSFFSVLLKDGSQYDIYTDDCVGLWKDGKYYHTEPEPPIDDEAATG